MKSVTKKNKKEIKWSLKKPKISTQLLTLNYIDIKWWNKIYSEPNTFPSL
jgi:hypothetical protein